MGIHQKEIFFNLSNLVHAVLQHFENLNFEKTSFTLCLLDDCNKLIRLPFVVNDSTEIAN